MLLLLLLLDLLVPQAVESDTVVRPIDVSVQRTESDFDVLENLGPRYSIVRPAPGMTYLYRYNCGGDSVVDIHGNLWMGDDTRYSHCWAESSQYRIEEQHPVYGSFGMAEDVVTIRTQHTGMYIDEHDLPLLATYRFGRQDLYFRFPVSSYQNYSVELYVLSMPHPPYNSNPTDLLFNGQRGRLSVLYNQGVRGHSRVTKCTFMVRTDSLDYIDIHLERGRIVLSAIAISTLPEIAAMSDEVPRPEGQGFPYSEGLNWEKLRAITKANESASAEIEQ